MTKANVNTIKKQNRIYRNQVIERQEKLGKRANYYIFQFLNENTNTREYFTKVADNKMEAIASMKNSCGNPKIWVLMQEETLKNDMAKEA